ncbi:hypothetical protein V6N13_004743 [Hibiscus sabdariffa]
MKKFAELGLEPPPDMPEAFKICIQYMGGTEIKLVIQNFIRVTDLDPQQNHMPMPLKQVSEISVDFCLAETFLPYVHQNRPNGCLLE